MADHVTKKSKPKPEMRDVVPPEEAAVAGESRLRISARPMIGRDILPDDSTDKKSEAEQASPHLTATKRPVIAPLEPTKVEVDADVEKAEQQPKAESKAENEGTEDSTPQQEQTEPANPTPAAAGEEAKETTPQADASEVKTADEMDEVATDGATDMAKQPDAETLKAVKEAERAAKRQKELEQYIDSKKFFVPINAAAQKRSIQISSLLTIVVFLLALILIDLMLDSGIILLVQKIPHTHFFTSMN